MNRIEFTTSNQLSIPSFIYGTAWKKGETARLVQLAVASGFRGIDTANQPVHYNEPAVGEALQAAGRARDHTGDALYRCAEVLHKPYDRFQAHAKT